MTESRPRIHSPRRAGGDGVPEVFCSDEQSGCTIDLPRWRQLAISSLLHEGVHGACELSVFFVDEATKENVLKKATEAATSTDSSSITFKKGDYGITAYLILGNDPDELVSDIGSNSTMAEQAFNKPWQTFINEWECKECPTVTN